MIVSLSFILFIELFNFLVLKLGQITNTWDFWSWIMSLSHDFSHQSSWWLLLRLRLFDLIFHRIKNVPNIQCYFWWIEDVILYLSLLWYKYDLRYETAFISVNWCISICTKPCLQTRNWCHFVLQVTTWEDNYDTHEPLSLSLISPLSLFQDINKRLSLPADIRLPEGYLEKFAMNSPPFDKPMSRRLRRASLVSAYCVCLSLCAYLHLCIRVQSSWN